MATDYWWDFVRLMLPGLAIELASAVPVAVGTLLAAIHLRRRNAGAFFRNIWSSTAAGLAALWMLWGFLFGNAGRGSSTAGLVFLFVPIYSAIALGIGYGLGALVYRLAAPPHGEGAVRISPAGARFIAVPIAILAVLLFGMLKHCIGLNDLAVAERATSAETLHFVYEKSLRGEADPFGVPLFLGQNPNTPADILAALAKHEHVSVRTFVARHANTPLPALEQLADDCDERIRQDVAERLKSPPRSAPSCKARAR